MIEDPYKTDLYSLRIFRAVFELRSFSGAALSLGLSQSVVSYAIDRLRNTFNDQLFLRQGGGVVPTDRCVSIANISANLLDDFESLISPQDVDPAKLNQTFRVGCNFIERVLIVPLITKALRELAPAVNLKIVQAGTDGVRHLSQGVTDLLIGPIRPDSEKFFCRSLVKDRYVCVMDPYNPLVKCELTPQNYLAANRVEVSYGEEWTSDYLAKLDTILDYHSEPKITVPSPGEIASIIRGTDLIATIPRLYAATLKPYLHVMEFPLPSTLEIDLVWSRRSHGSETQRWFRDLVVSAAQPLQRSSQTETPSRSKKIT